MERAAAGEETVAGALFVPLRRIPDERGTIIHMLKRTDEHFLQFGEIYFTTIYRDVVKGWHKHRENDAELRLHLRSDQARAL